MDLGADGNKWVLRIPQSSSITGASPSDSFMLYEEHSLEESYSSAEKQSAYSKAPAYWANSHLFTQLNGQTVLLLTIQFSISHLSVDSLNVKQFYLTHR